VLTAGQILYDNDPRYRGRKVEKRGWHTEARSTELAAKAQAG
jgi:hypothetical protein